MSGRSDEFANGFGGISPREASEMHGRALGGHIFDMFGPPEPKIPKAQVRKDARTYDQITTERWSNANGAGRYRARFTSPDGRKMSASVPHDFTTAKLTNGFLEQHEAAAHNLARKLGLGPEDVEHIGPREGGGHVFQVRRP